MPIHLVLFIFNFLTIFFFCISEKPNLFSFILESFLKFWIWTFSRPVHCLQGTILLAFNKSKGFFYDWRILALFLREDKILIVTVVIDQSLCRVLSAKYLSIDYYQKSIQSDFTSMLVGFRRGFSCSQIHNILTYLIKDAVKYKDPLYCLTIDISGVFENVLHSNVLYSLALPGV